MFIGSILKILSPIGASLKEAIFNAELLKAEISPFISKTTIPLGLLLHMRSFNFTLFFVSIICDSNSELIATSSFVFILICFFRLLFQMKITPTRIIAEIPPILLSLLISFILLEILAGLFSIHSI